MLDRSIDVRELILNADLKFMDLYQRHGLLQVDALFIKQLRAADSDLCHQLLQARSTAASTAETDQSALLLRLAPFLETFIAGFFGIEKEIKLLADRQAALTPLYACKKQFVQRVVKKSANDYLSDDAALLLADELAGMFGEPLSELAFASHVMLWLQSSDASAEALEKAGAYAVWAVKSESGRRQYADGVLFRLPTAVNPGLLVPFEQVEINGTKQMQGPRDTLRHREGFQLTDAGTDLTGALDQANYCVWCHHQGRDSCSTGMLDKKSGAFRDSSFGVQLAGCPLNEQISEMNMLASGGHMLAALAVVCVNNPMLAATGHRICNDCVKACIYQKQEAVSIPEIESRILKEILNLPWGFEIYSLLTRWNPLNLARPLPRPDSGYKVLVAGLGPAGFTLAHQLMNEGHTIVAVDGLKVEPLPADISGVTTQHKRVTFKPVHNISDLYESLDDRVMAGFGGVTEYGITVRWDKNYLKIIRLLIERRAQFAMFGGVRLGSTLNFDDAFAMGFDHIALCLGAGAPTTIPITNGMARGVRQASDFLMALQLTGAARSNSIANLQIRLPVVVVGGGLTAIDTATEALAYYPLQVEKFLSRYELLAAERGADRVRAGWSEEESIIADEFLAHARAIRSEREAAAEAGRTPDILHLLNNWGGSTVAYRRRLIDAPSYRLNHEEITRAMQEGIRFCELLSPASIAVDRFGHAEAIDMQRMQYNEDGQIEACVDTTIQLPAHAIIVAAGTRPNVVLSEEYPGQVPLDGKYFQAVDIDGNPVTPERSTKPDRAYMLNHIRDDGRAISFFGDLHPSYAGNVVKAIASATQGYPMIDRILAKQPPSQVSASALFARLAHELCATVQRVERLTPNIVEVTVHAPHAARAFQPGQFYRLQNYEANAKHAAETLLAMEGVALTGAEVDVERGLVSMILLEMGGSSDLCAYLQEGEPVVLMGPTGHASDIVGGENVLLIGGGLGNAVLFSIGSAFRKAGSRVLYFAGYKQLIDRYKVAEIEAAADQIVWCCDQAPGFAPGRPQDSAFVGNMIKALAAYGRGELGSAGIPLHQIDRLIVIGSAGLMSVITDARHGVLQRYLKPDHIALGSINSPMQCMMKKICGQCMQQHKDPETGKPTRVVFSCFNQDQLLDEVDFKMLMQRLQQQSVQEKLTKQWIDRCLQQLGLRQNRAN
ncbi:MAG: pyridine nucleotide-disulfide oxidoreductase [Zetaproteobacteria bacterium CG12_big_fil_rev_8_21_14_0_65_54_13]|nr:MAG: pyridine nucleotide-disulfide oxidoreductase [Zetaproteobacteria bacterium CG12_big_fil_rev_8_21_14_0_65_54_13]PIX53453.1 MAG: pyridine nucleotide-disulfide oxidoreductase [Zetaproteobacteria bacterium CG_4_10_14_3_um_filter_54_28]PJA29182.1 MAG: pyridine nucleotide-disulfide oxidoreductase [Zetaproteobacteria bacterium CG_4_9_14_3_um_filter_54_145]